MRVDNKCLLTAELNISSSLRLGSLPFLGLTNKYNWPMSGRQRRNFSMITLPKNPVPPVSKISLPVNVAPIRSGRSSTFVDAIVSFESFLA